jgi:hypothetical protein
MKLMVKSWTLEDPNPREGEEFTVRVCVGELEIGFARVRVIRDVDGDLTHQIVGGDS